MLDRDAVTRYVAAMALAALLATRPALAADTAAAALPSVQDVLAKVKAAEGTAPAAFREVDETVHAGITEHTTFVRSGEDYRETDDAGPLLTARGMYHGQKWYQNANGQTILEQPDPGLATHEEYRQTLSRITQPVDGYIVADLNRRGYGTKRYVDAATWRVVRTERIDATSTTVITYDDFRSVAGFTQPFHETDRDGHPENDREVHTISFEPLSAAEADVTIPHPRRLLVEFPAGTKTVRLPARLIDGRFIVRLNVGSRGLDFELDSGASGISVEDGVLASLGIRPFDAYSNGVNAGRFRDATAIVPEMDIGALKMHDVVVRTLPTIDTGGDIPDARVVGLLGFDFIGELVLKLDYVNGIVTAFDPNTFVVPPVSASGFTADIRVGSGVPETTITVNGAVGERFIIDTGAGVGVMAFDYFQRRHPEALADERGGAALPIHMLGVGGEFNVKPLVLKKVQLGSVVFEDTQVLLSDSHTYSDDTDGVIGQEFLELFDVYLDYVDSKAYFVFNRTFNRLKRPVK